MPAAASEPQHALVPPPAPSSDSMSDRTPDRTPDSTPDSAPSSKSASSPKGALPGGVPYGGFDPLAETVRPGAADVAVTRRLSRPGARRAEPKPADPPGYRLRHLIGRGGFGAVWLATESATGKQVAVKTFRHVRALDWPLLTREVEKLAALDASRHVVQLLGVGWEADPPYYVMEYLPDGSLADLLAGSSPNGASPDGAPLPPARAAELAEGIAAGLVHAHGSGILHCDLKPGNVLLDRDGVPRLCDFGQARGVGGGGPDGGSGSGSAGGTKGGSASDSASEQRTGGRALGTLFYMPPEQVAPDAAPDARWDVYALGAVMYEMLTGAPPHRTAEFSAKLKGLLDRGTPRRLPPRRVGCGPAERPRGRARHRRRADEDRRPLPVRGSRGPLSERPGGADGVAATRRQRGSANPSPVGACWAPRRSPPYCCSWGRGSSAEPSTPDAGRWSNAPWRRTPSPPDWSPSAWNGR